MREFSHFCDVVIPFGQIRQEDRTFVISDVFSSDTDEGNFLLLVIIVVGLDIQQKAPSRRSVTEKMIGPCTWQLYQSCLQSLVKFKLGISSYEVILMKISNIRMCMQLYIFMSAKFDVSSKCQNERITFDILYISAFCIYSVQFLDFPQMYKRMYKSMEYISHISSLRIFENLLTTICDMSQNLYFRIECGNVIPVK